MNNYQPKVNNTQKYEDSQGSHIVTPTKLLLLQPSSKHDRVTCYTNSDNRSKLMRPILISETEEIEVGDWVYDSFQNLGQIQDKSELNFKHKQWKVLALPEHFSKNHLQAIVDGKMEEGDEVLVKCKKKTRGDRRATNIVYHHRIHLNQQNHITFLI